VSGGKVKTDEKHDGGVVLVPPSKSIKLRKMVLPERAATATAASGANKYLESRSRVRELLAQSKKAEWVSHASGPGEEEDSNKIASRPKEEALDIDLKGSKGSKRGKERGRGWGGDTVGEVLMPDMSLDQLASKASRGDVRAKAAVGIRMLFNEEQPSLPLAETGVRKQTALQPAPASLGAVGDLEETSRMGLPFYPTGLEEAGEGNGELLEEEEEGDFEDPDLRQALYWLRDAARQNITAAQRFLGHCYLRGIGVQQNNKTGIGWIARAAKTGNGAAQFEMGRAWEEGVGLGRNLTKALACYKKAADAGWPEGHIWLGHAAVRGMHAAASLSGAGDVWAALESYSSAAAMGIAEAWLYLGSLYYSGVEGSEERAGHGGKGVGGGKEEKDRAHGRRGVKPSDKGRKECEGFKTSETMAFRCWREGAILGDAEAMFLLGLMYLKGSKVEQSDRKGTHSQKCASVALSRKRY
jgi:TPR repeat protein